MKKISFILLMLFLWFIATAYSATAKEIGSKSSTTKRAFFQDSKKEGLTQMVFGNQGKTHMEGHDHLGPKVIYYGKPQYPVYRGYTKIATRHPIPGRSFSREVSLIRLRK